MPFFRIQNLTGSDLVVDPEIPVIPKHSVITTKDFPTSALERFQQVLTHLRASRKIDYEVVDSTTHAIDPELEIATHHTVTEVVASSGGSGGSSLEPYVYTKTYPSNVWVINHNLGYRPMIDIVDTMGRKVSVDVVHVSVNQVRVTSSVAFSGFARCV